MIDKQTIDDYRLIADAIGSNKSILTALNRIRSKLIVENCLNCGKLRTDRNKKLKTIRKLRLKIKDLTKTNAELNKMTSELSSMEIEMMETGWEENDFARNLTHGLFSNLGY